MCFFVLFTCEMRPKIDLGRLQHIVWDNLDTMVLSIITNFAAQLKTKRNMNLNNFTKSELVGRAYVDYANEVFALFKQYNICDEDVEDLVQEVFIKVLGVDTLCAETLKGLVMVSAYNLRNDYFRRQAFRRRALEAMPTIDEWSNHGIAKVEADNIIEIENAIAEKCLSSANYKVYTMCRYDDLSATEIAEELGVILRSVESRLYNSRRVVRQKLAKAL